MTYPTEVQKVIDRYTKEIPVDLGRIADNFKIVLNPVMMGNNSGKIYKKDNSYIIDYNTQHPATQQRFTIAHEYGHYFLHRKEIDSASRTDSGLTDNGLYRSGLPTQLEVAANKFAANLLMPKKQLYSFIDEAVQDKRRLTTDIIAYYFNVSKQAICIRLGIPI